MKKIFLIVSVCFFQILLHSYSIIYVHIGDRIPNYLEDSLRQARYFNQDADLYLICNRKAAKRFASKVQDLRFKFVFCENLQKSQSHRQFDIRLGWEDGFWKRAIERFFYLDEMMKQYSVQDVFHLEGDNLLYVDLQELLPVFHNNYQGLGVTYDNENRGIGGFMYIPTPQKMHQFVSFIAENAHLKLYDMYFLSLYKNMVSRQEVTSLPIIMDEYLDEFKLQSDTGDTANNPGFFANHSEIFGSIFDAAAIGQYLGGIDPIHMNSQPGFINETCLFNPSHFTYSWERDHNDRLVPYANFHEKKWRINNLHIHCKNLRKYSTYE